jgi:FkbH-like protein
MMDSLDDLRAALPGFTFNDYLRHLKSVEEQCADGKPLRVAVLRSYTVEPIEPVLTLRFLLDGYRPQFWFGGFNQYVQEMLETDGPLQRHQPNVILLLVRVEDVLPDFMDGYATRPSEAWESRVIAGATELVSLASKAADACSAQVVIQNASLVRAYFGSFDAQRHDGQQQLVQTFNRTLAREAERAPGVSVWDFDGFTRIHGADTLYDPKQWYVARNPFRQSAYTLIGGALFRHIRSALGRIKKCVVVDLDNTLWGGVAGEDGIEGIRLGQTYPGNCYRDFQKELLKLYHRGILLAINSKNNEDDALRIIDEHPDMVLRRDHFAAMRINWQDKASNLRSLASELNIGVDSLVFIDDNPVECELVRRECPECDVIQLPDKPYLLPAVVSMLPGIENIRLTDEDRQKGEMYRANAARREHEERHTNIEDFLRSLEITVEIAAATPYSIPRIAQLTQKTNQWNMTTRRYTDVQVQSFASDESRAVLSVASRDRFGNDGIVGVCILEFRGQECVIDTFLLSCRVIGRGIEQSMLATAADLARARGASMLAAEFLPTKKNKPAEGFYERSGFTKGEGSWYRASLGRETFPFPFHIRLATADRQQTL